MKGGLKSVLFRVRKEAAFEVQALLIEVNPKVEISYLQIN